MSGGGGNMWGQIIAAAIAAANKPSGVHSMPMMSGGNGPNNSNATSSSHSPFSDQFKGGDAISRSGDVTFPNYVPPVPYPPAAGGAVGGMVPPTPYESYYGKIDNDYLLYGGLALLGALVLLKKKKG